MAKARKNKRGFTFENRINLSDWAFNRLEYKQADALEKFEESIHRHIEKERKKLESSLGSVERQIRSMASEALQISFEKEIDALFCSLQDQPEMMRICFGDFSEDGYYVYIDLKAAIKECLLDNCAKDGYLRDDVAPAMMKFADMLANLEREIRNAIRPKDGKEGL